MLVFLARDPNRSAPYEAAVRQALAATPALAVASVAVTQQVWLQPALPDAAHNAQPVAFGFASAVAVDAYWALGVTAQQWLQRATLVIAVGPATAAALQRYGIAATCAQTANAEGMAASLAAQAPTTTQIVLPRAQDGRVVAETRLRTYGYHVWPLSVYATRARTLSDLTAYEAHWVWRLAGHTRTDAQSRATDAPPNEPAHASPTAAAWAVVFAPSQVHALVALLREARFVDVPTDIKAAAIAWLAIGATTAAALRDLGITRIAYADTPSPEAIAAAAAQLRDQR